MTSRTAFSLALVFGLLSLAFSAPTALRYSVTDENGQRVLKSAHGYQTVSLLDGGSTGLYYDSAKLIGKLRPQATRVVLLGLGGGEMLRVARRTLPSAAFVGVEIDPGVVDAAQTTFDVGFAQVFRADAIEWISVQPPASNDAVMVDLYDDDKLVPGALTPRFFTDVARALRPGGILLMNVDPPSLYPSVARAAEEAGFSIWRDDTWVRDGNVILVGQKSIQDFRNATP